jgi:hypothetical protein
LREDLLEDVLHVFDQFCPLLDQTVGAPGAGGLDRARDGKHRAPLFGGDPRGDERSALLPRLNDNDAERDSADDPVSRGEIGGVGRSPEGKFRNQGAMGGNVGGERFVFRRIEDVDAAPQDGDGSPLAGERPPVCSSSRLSFSVIYFP